MLGRLLILLAILLLSRRAFPQALEAQLDEERFLRGLLDLQLPEVLEHYIKTHPPADDVQSAFYDIALQRLRLNEPGLTQGARQEALERALAARAKLIADHPDDPRRAVWMADQAWELYYDFLPIDAAGLTALFGLPDEAQRARAQRVGREMHEMAVAAENAIGGAILDLEAQRDYETNIGLQQRRRRLAEIERDRRIPFLRGIGAFLHAEFNAGGPEALSAAERERLYELAAQVLAPLAERLEGHPQVQARVYAGLASARLRRFDAAEALFRAAATAPTAASADVFAARMGGVISRTLSAPAAPGAAARAGLEALDSIEPRYAEADPAAARENLFYRVLIADQRFLLRAQLAESAPAAQRPSLFADAFHAYIALLNAEPAPSGIPRETIRSIVFERLVRATGDAGGAGRDDLPLDQLPAIVRIARADRMAQDAATRAQAIVMLEELLARRPPAAPLSAEEQAAALFALGRAMYGEEQLLFAARRFTELARDHPADEQAERAIELAATIAAELERRAPNDLEARRALEEALTVLLDRYPNLATIDHWRYLAGRLAMRAGRFDDAARRLAEVAPAAGVWLDAQFMLAANERERMRALALESGDQQPPARAAAETLLQAVNKSRPILEKGITSAAADAHRAADLRHYLASLRVYQAEAMMQLNRAQDAISILAGIEDDRTLEGGVIGEALRVRINAYQSLNKPEEFLRDIERFARASPQQVGPVLGPMLSAMQRDVERLRDDGREEQARALAERTLLPAAKLLETWLTSGTRPQADETAYGLALADAFRVNGLCNEALAWYDRLLLDSPDALALLKGKAECLFALGSGEQSEQRLADAMALYKRIGAGGPSLDHDAYWLAQLRMLEILDRLGRNTDQIVPRIERLRQQDSSFGGEKFRRGFEALRSKQR